MTSSHINQTNSDCRQAGLKFCEYARRIFFYKTLISEKNYGKLVKDPSFNSNRIWSNLYDRL